MLGKLFFVSNYLFLFAYLVQLIQSVFPFPNDYATVVILQF
jgi:hypothetical protein